MNTIDSVVLLFGTEKNQIQFVLSRILPRHYNVKTCIYFYRGCIFTGTVLSLILKILYLHPGQHHNDRFTGTSGLDFIREGFNKYRESLILRTILSQ